MTRDHSHFIHFCQMSHRWGRPLNPTGQFTPSSPTCFPQVMGGMGHLCTCALVPPPPPPPPPYLRIWLTNFVKIWCVNRDPMVTRFTISRRWGDSTFARASPISLSRKPLSLDIEATPKTDLSLSASLVHRQTWRLTGYERRIRPSEFIFN